MNIAYCLFATAERQPKQAAILFYDDVITYGQLRENVERLAKSLFSLGINPGDRVALFMGNYIFGTGVVR